MTLPAPPTPLPRTFAARAMTTLYWSSFALVAIYALSVYVPLLQQQIELFHMGWLTALNVARDKHLAFGRDIIFTYGPLGCVWTGYFPQSFGLLIFVWASIGTLAFTAMLLAARSAQLPRFPGIFAVPAIFILSAGEHSSMHDTRLLILPIFLIAYHFCIDDRPAHLGKSLLIGALAIAGLIKFTYLVAALLACAAISVDELIRFRRPVSVFLFCILYLIGWKLCGQHFGDLPAYFAGSMDVAAGYGETMSMTTPTEATDIWIFALPCLFLLALMRVNRPGARQAWRALLHTAALIALLLIIFKAGYVRHDQHEIISTSSLPPMVAFYAMGNWKSLRNKFIAALWIVCLSLSIFAASYSYSAWNGENLLTRSGKSFSTAGKEFVEAWRIVAGRAPAMAGEYAALVKSNRDAFPLPHVDGTVDVFTASLQLALFNGLDASPRPAVGGYAAYTPKLAEADAEFLRGERAPANLFFDFETANECPPTMEDGRALLEILARYDLVGKTGAFLQLRKSASARHYTLTPILQTTGELGRGVSMPNTGDALIWAVIELKPTPIGRVISALYKPPPLVIALTLKNDRTTRRRFLPGPARSGFLLSPLLASTDDFAAILRGSHSPIPLRAFRIEGVNGVSPADYQREFSIRLFRVDFSN